MMPLRSQKRMREVLAPAACAIRPIFIARRLELHPGVKPSIRSGPGSRIAGMHDIPAALPLCLPGGQSLPNRIA